eukprot:gene23142-biopygen8452
MIPAILATFASATTNLSSLGPQPWLNVRHKLGPEILYGPGLIWSSSFCRKPATRRTVVVVIPPPPRWVDTRGCSPPFDNRFIKGLFLREKPTAGAIKDFGPQFMPYVKPWLRTFSSSTTDLLSKDVQSQLPSDDRFVVALAKVARIAGIIPASCRNSTGATFIPAALR